MLTRRNFLKLTGASTLAWYVATQTGWTQRAIAQIPGGTLDPNSVTKYATSMLIPPVMPRAATITMPGGKPADYYEISMKQFSQQILPAGLPATTVWGYGAVTKSATSRGLLLHNAPSLTIESTWKRPVRIKWINDLKDAAGNFRPHLLPVDQTLHWANPPGGTEGRDMRPTFTSTRGPYTGPVPIVTHLHGAAGVGDDSDGYAEAWYLPAAGNIPAGFATEGTWYNFFKGKAASKFAVAWGPGFATFQYPNDQREATLWYHDHTLGMTRLNVYAGPAGFFLVRGGPEGDKAVLDRRTNTTAVLPSPTPNEGDRFPPNKTYFEIPIAVQDRSFNEDGSLFYPDTRAFFDGYAGPYIPTTDVSPIWNPEFFGDLEPGVLRQHDHGQRQHLAVPDRPAAPLPAAVPQRLPVALPDPGLQPDPGCGGLADRQRGRLPPGPGEPHRRQRQPAAAGPGRAGRPDRGLHQRAGGQLRPGQRGTGRAVRRWSSGRRLPGRRSRQHRQVLQFRVVPAVAADPTTPPQFLVLPAIAALTGGATRPLALLEMASGFFEDAPVEARLGTVEGGTLVAKTWEDEVTENPAVGATEVWEYYNATADAHPMHIHEVLFQVVNRQAITVDESTMTVQVVPGSVPTPPEPWENGWKGHRHRLPGPGDPAAPAVRQPGPVRLALPHRRARGQRDDAALPDRAGPARPAGGCFENPAGRCFQRPPESELSDRFGDAGIMGVAGNGGGEARSRHMG